MRDYNFFEPYQRRKGLQMNIKSPVFLGILVILLIAAASTGLVVRNTMLAMELAATAAELEAIRSTEEFQEADRLQRSIDAMAEYDAYAAEALSRIEQGDILNTKFLDTLGKAMPSSVSLENASMTRQSATLAFRTPDRKAAAELLSSLNQSGLFLHTELTSVSSEQDKPGYRAEILTIVKAGDAE